MNRNTLFAAVMGCKIPECKQIYMICWICGYCDAHCTCPDLDPEEELLSETPLS